MDLPVVDKSKDRCRDCAFFQAITTGGDSECRQQPPRPLPVRDGVMSIFVPTRADAWCGQFRRSLEVVQ